MRLKKGLPIQQAGQSMVEAIVSVTVGILVVTALTFATIFSLRNANFAKNSNQATKLAQEGIEQVRSGRDRNECINSLATAVNSWNGDSSNIACPGSGSIWGYQISSACTPNCYFKFNGSTLQYFGFGTDIPNNAEDPLGDGKYKRVVILSDDSASFTTQKTVTVIVRWSDATGSHDSKLTTILRKL